MSKYTQAFVFFIYFLKIVPAFSDSLMLKLHNNEIVPLNNYQLEVEGKRHYIINDIPSNVNVKNAFEIILSNGLINYNYQNRQLRIVVQDKAQLLNLNYDSKEYRAFYVKYTIDRMLQKLSILIGDEESEGILTGMNISIDADTGCNAVYGNEIISLFIGTQNCISSALSPTILVHEIGHFIHDRLAQNILAQDSDYKEAIADIFAAVLFNTPIIGDGFFKTRLVSHLRDIRGVFNYADNWRGTYSGSRILSSFYWELFEILKLNFNLEEAQKHLLKFMFQNISEISGNSSLHGNDMNEHMAFFMHKITNTIWAQNPFILAKIKTAIKKRFHTHVEEDIKNNIQIEKIEYAPIGAKISLTGNIEEQYKSKYIWVELYGRRKKVILNSLPKEILFSLPLRRTCGRDYVDQIRMITQDGVVIEQRAIHHTHMAMSYEQVENQLLFERNYATEVLNFEFEAMFGLFTNEIIENLILKVDSNHPYPNDLVVQFKDSNEIILGHLIGVDEDRLSPLYLDRVGSLNRLVVNVQDVSQGIFLTEIKLKASYDKLKLYCH